MLSQNLVFEEHQRVVLGRYHELLLEQNKTLKHLIADDFRFGLVQHVFRKVVVHRVRVDERVQVKNIFYR